MQDFSTAVCGQLPLPLSEARRTAAGGGGSLSVATPVETRPSGMSAVDPTPSGCETWVGAHTHTHTHTLRIVNPFTYFHFMANFPVDSHCVCGKLLLFQPLFLRIRLQTESCRIEDLQVFPQNKHVSARGPFHYLGMCVEYTNGF